jgi:hypothetical protein
MLLFNSFLKLSPLFLLDGLLAPPRDVARPVARPKPARPVVPFIFPMF